MTCARLGAYEILGELGRGGMGVVYRGRAPDGRAVAVKLLKGSSVARFDRERRLLAELAEEDGFVPLLDAGDSPQGPWIAMPLLGGGTLRERFSRISPERERDVAPLGIALARALARAHARGIVHRDLKPENVLFTASNVPLVADLGLAKHFVEDARTLSLSRGGELRGTIGYMPPEQLLDAKSVTDKADVFALGAMLFEALAGRPAFAGSTALAVLDRVERGERESLAALCPEAPRWLVAAIEASLAPDPKKRPSAAELERALEERHTLAVARAPRTARRTLVVLTAGSVGLVLVLAASAMVATPRTGSELATSLARGRGALAAKRCGEALESVREAQARRVHEAPAAKDEVVALVAAVQAVAIETSDWTHERDASSILEALGSRAGQDAHLAARILQDPQAPRSSDLAELTRKPRASLERDPLLTACTVAWQRALTARRIEQLSLEKLFLPETQRSRVATLVLDEVAAKSRSFEKSTVLNALFDVTSVRRPFELFTLARRLDPSLDPFARPALRLLSTVRYSAHIRRSDDIARALAGLDPHPVLAYVEFDANREKRGTVRADVERVLDAIERCPKSRARGILADTLLTSCAAGLAARRVPLAERFAPIVSNGPEPQEILRLWRENPDRLGAENNMFMAPGLFAEFEDE